MFLYSQDTSSSSDTEISASEPLHQPFTSKKPFPPCSPEIPQVIPRGGNLETVASISSRKSSESFSDTSNSSAADTPLKQIHRCENPTKNTKPSADSKGYDSPESETIYFNGDTNLPILREGKVNWGTQEIADLILNGKSKRICNKRPLAPQRNSTFLINSARLQDLDDWKCDDHGAWKNCGSSGRIVSMNNGKVIESSRLPRAKANRPKLQQNQYLFLSTYYRHGRYSDFKRKSIFAFNFENKRHDLILVQYLFTGKEHHVSPTKHGNTKSTKKFLPTAPSTKKRLISALSATARGPLSVFDTVSEELGGLKNSYAGSDMPRSLDQVWYMRKKMRQKGEKDQVSELIDKAHTLPYNLNGLQLTPSIRFIVSDPQTLENIAICCANYELCTPFCVDTTYGIGEFFVTTTCYKNLKLVNKNNKEPPTFPGPALFHVDQDESVFSYFAQTMIAAKNELKSILFVGSDRDKALVNGMAKHFHIATNLFCKKHLEDDIIRKFASLKHITAQVKQTILIDIFGSDAKHMKGLIDCENEATFDNLCLEYYRKWDRLESSCRENIDPKFSTYFQRYIEKDMRNGMLLGKRRQAGLHDDFFYNNPNESVNFRYKNKLRQEKSLKETSGKPAKKCTLSEAVDVYKAMLEEYNRNAERAILGIGPYELAPDFAKFYVPPNRWSQFSQDAKLQKVSLYHNAKIRAPSESRRPSIHVSQPLETNECQSEQDLDFSNYPASSHEVLLNAEDTGLIDFGQSGLPENFRIDWRGAASILTDKAAMKTPWTDQSYVVRSDSKPKEPHPVTFSRSKNTVSCNCQRYKYHSVCKHAIAVAHLEGFLAKWTEKWAPNLSQQMQGTVPSRVGQKKNDKSNRKRHPAQHRDIENFIHRIPAQSNGPLDEQLNVIFVNRTKATTCYGCGGKFRTVHEMKQGIIPPVPYDIILTRRERRVFSRAGTHKITIAKTPENVYYHPKKNCLAKKISMITPAIFYVEDSFKDLLSPAHKNLLNAEFRLGLR